MNTLAVRNIAQKIMWEEELSGQISDGKWENARPMDHYRSWSNVSVVVDPTNVGRDFYVRKDNYNFVDRDLLIIVGERMLDAVRQQLPSYSHGQMVSDLRDLKQIIRRQRSLRQLA